MIKICLITYVYTTTHKLMLAFNHLTVLYDEIQCVSLLSLNKSMYVDILE